MQPYDRLEVWRRAHALAVEAFRLTTGWREFELRSQLRRSAMSVAANLAEGAGSTSHAQFARFIGYALASAAELHYHFRLAHDLGLLGRADHDTLSERVDEVRRMLTGLLRRVRAESDRDSPRHPPPPDD